MIATQQKYSVRVLHLQTEEESDCLNWIVTSINEVTDHYKLRFRDSATLFEHFFHIKELPMNIPCNFDRGINDHNIGLIYKDTFDHIA